MIKITLFTYDEEKEEQFENEDLADAYLLDQIRGFLSLDKNSFAIIKQEKKETKFAIIENNCLKKINFQEFFNKII